MPDLLRQKREEHFLTQEELAKKAGLHRSTLVRIEMGQEKPRAKTVRRLARALGIQARELVGTA